MTRREDMGVVRRLVVKVGSTTVVTPDLERLVDEIQALREGGAATAVVSSGAVAVGMSRLGVSRRPADLSRVQALAAAGQAELMGRWNAAFGRHGVKCAQILMTHEDLSDRRHFLNVRHTLEAALTMGLVPVVNENDSVATEELRFGDNDRLAAALGIVMDADLVVLLSDVDALYDADPRRNADTRPIHEVPRIDARIRAMAGTAGSAVGTGGMRAKVAAADLAVNAGIPLIVAKGSEPGILRRILDGETTGTRFVPPPRIVARRRHWIGFLSKVRGTLEVDVGAAAALQRQGSSLLSIGVRRVRGHFRRGDAVRVVGPDGGEIGRGLVAYDAEDLRRIAGRRSDEVCDILGGSAADPVVHRNDLLVLDSRESHGRF
ncbi:MAG: glutamate 5-kinase [Myxococcota bacterium]